MTHAAELPVRFNEAAARRSDLYTRATNQMTQLRRAIQTASHCSLEPAEIVRIASQPYTRPVAQTARAISRQAVYVILEKTTAETAVDIWHANGEPNAEEARQLLEAEAAATVPLRHEYDRAVAWLVQEMQRARSRGHGAAAVAAASGLASKAAYEYLAAGERYEKIHHALQAASFFVDLFDTDRDPDADLDLRGLQPWVAVHKRTSDLDQALADIGEQRAAEKPGAWVRIIPVERAECA